MPLREDGVTLPRLDRVRHIRAPVGIDGQAPAGRGPGPLRAVAALADPAAQTDRRRGARIVQGDALRIDEPVRVAQFAAEGDGELRARGVVAETAAGDGPRDPEVPFAVRHLGDLGEYPPGRKDALDRLVARAADPEATRLATLHAALRHAMIGRKGIHPNLDYPAGLAYHLMGFDIPVFTPIFVMSRITGWTAHITEQLAHNALIRPLASYDGPGQRAVPGAA